MCCPGLCLPHPPNTLCFGDACRDCLAGTPACCPFCLLFLKFPVPDRCLRQWCSPARGDWPHWGALAAPSGDASGCLPGNISLCGVQTRDAAQCPPSIGQLQQQRILWPKRSVVPRLRDPSLLRPPREWRGPSAPLSPVLPWFKLVPVGLTQQFLGVG